MRWLCLSAAAGRMASVYRLNDRASAFRSVVYRQTGHEYLSEMKQEMADWCAAHLKKAQ